MADSAIVERMVLPPFLFKVTVVMTDAKLDEYDHVFANIVTSEGKFQFAIGFHAPVGTLQKSKSYNSDSTDKEVWVKQLISVGKFGARMDVVFGDVDPAEGISYAAEIDPIDLPAGF